MLSELSFPAQMSKGIDDIASNFYVPCMQRAIDYARITGYFSSGVYLVAWPSIRGFAERRGRIRIICSPVFAERDVDALEAGYQARLDGELAEALIAELDAMMADERLRRPTQALAGLIADGIIDVRIAELDKSAPAATKRIFHDKVGIFTDASGESVGFRGTMNETYLGLAADGNLESIDIFPRWAGGRDEDRLRDAVQRFEALWINEMPAVSVRPIPDLAIAELRDIARQRAWPDVIAELEAEMAQEAETAQQAAARDETAEIVPLPRRQLWPHQAEAIKAWEERGRTGILAHATGSGKTTTALEAARLRLAAGEPPVIVVPSEYLLRQWAGEVESQLADIQPKVLKCGGGNRDWADGLLRSWLRRPATESRIVIAVLNSAVMPDFRRQLEGLSFLLVIDEVHRVGSPEFIKVLSVDGRSRLGLSATPRRYGDPSGTAALMDYFRGVAHSYTLEQAIEDGFLTQYTYDPHVVRLTAFEQRQWDSTTAQIRTRMARVAGQVDASTAFDDRRLKLLLIRRARIGKQASAKIGLAASVLKQEMSPGDRWLVYCDDRVQMTAVREALSRAGISSLAYFHEMTSDQALTVRDFELNGGALVAIKCLDEGVDIPQATHALVLASSRNPREFIQRRGRILRKADGKFISHLHDALVIPADDSSESASESLLWGELARGAHFARAAINPQAKTKLEQIVSDLGLDVLTLADVGYEDDSGDAEASE